MNRLPIYFVLENIYDTYNIGAFFRLAESIAATKIYLCGETEYPPHPKISKSSKGLDKVMKWEYRKTAIRAIREMKEIGEINIVAVEQNPKSTPYNKAEYKFPLALVFGNESRGIKQSTLKLVDKIVEIPMYGSNKSLNVLSSASIVSYWAIQCHSRKNGNLYQ
jgi:tRNA G18 (ribose-2'-O)-methylase SpoU